jgi:hypothetical protein
MEERARLLGGMLRLTSEPQGGTSVELTVPILVPDWLPTVTGSAAETAAEVAEAGMAAAGIPTVEPSSTVRVPEAGPPPEPLPSLTSTADATQTAP